MVLAWRRPIHIRINTYMRIKEILDEDFINYKLPAMYIGTCFCGGKCCIDGGFPLNVCINDEWRGMPIIEYDDYKLCERYIANPITKAIIFCGLEPFEQYNEIIHFINILRNEYRCNDTIIIFTGYTKEECEVAGWLAELRKHAGIICKFGRFQINQNKHYDPILGIWLASDQQYAEVIS